MHAMIVHFPNCSYIITNLCYRRLTNGNGGCNKYSRSNSILIFYLNKYGFIIILLDKKKSVVLFSFDMVHLLAYQIEKNLLVLVERGKTAYYSVILVAFKH